MKKLDSTTEASPSVDRAFLNIIAAHKQGRAITDLSTALKQVTAAVQLTNKGGSVTLTMRIAPASKGDASTLVFLPKISAKIPETEIPGSIFYADADFNLVREDPNQASLPLQPLPAKPKAVPVPVPAEKASNAVPVPAGHKQA
jgi:hypothetical protein